jgi:hypothetical protein
MLRHRYFKQPELAPSSTTSVQLQLIPQHIAQLPRAVQIATQHRGVCWRTRQSVSHPVLGNRLPACLSRAGNKTYRPTFSILSPAASASKHNGGRLTPGHDQGGKICATASARVARRAIMKNRIARNTDGLLLNAIESAHTITWPRQASILLPFLSALSNRRSGAGRGTDLFRIAAEYRAAPKCAKSHSTFGESDSNHFF